MGISYMRGILAIVCIFSIHLSSKSQIVTISDLGMKGFFQAYYPSCIVGDQLDTQCPDIVNETFVSGVGSASQNLYGLQYFVNADSVLISNFDGPVIDYIPDNAKWLKIWYPFSTSIASFPDSAESIILDVTTFNSLPALPANLVSLHCNYCYTLSSLPTLPEGLETLILGTTSLDYLPELPDSLKVLQLGGNDLTYLPNLPEGLLTLDVLGEQGLTCLPPLPNSLLACPYPGLFMFSTGFSGLESQITCVPNVPPGITNTNGYAICVPGDSVNNPNDCMQYSSLISGYIYEDISNACVYDPGLDLGLEGAKLYLLDGNGDTAQITYSGSDGHYYFDQLVADNYTVAYDLIHFSPGCIGSPIDSLVTVTTTPTDFNNINFNAVCLGPGDAYATGAFPAGIIFPGQIHHLSIMHNVSGCDNGSATVKVVLNGPVNYISPVVDALIPSSVDGDTIFYDIPSLALLNTSSIKLKLEPETTATIEDAICIDVYTETTGETNTTNNAYTNCYQVMNSYDPNIKYVSHAVVEPGYDDWLTYTFFFQNTGNAPAFDVVVKDSLNDLLRHNTFEFLTASDPVEVHLYNDVVVFSFNDIMLPDSTSDPDGSIGFAQFRIKPQSGLPEGTEITNEVDIYFDYNAPITTDLVTTLYEVNDVSVPEKNLELTLYPNPAKNEVRVVINEKIERLQVLSLDGSVLITGNQNILNISSLANGVYLVQVHTTQGIYTAKIIKA